MVWPLDTKDVERCGTLRVPMCWCNVALERWDE